MSFEIINPESLGRPSGWNHGMLGPASGGVVRRRSDGTEVAGFVAQWDRALDRVLAVLRAAGGSAEQIGRMTVYAPTAGPISRASKPLGDVHRRHMGKHFPR